MSEPKELPRKTLREANFRKFEWYIATALSNKEVIVDKQTLLELRLRPQTFILRFDEAKRGFRLYEYKSDLIPPGTDVTAAKIVEMDDGSVKIKNELNRPMAKTVPLEMFDLDKEPPPSKGFVPEEVHYIDTVEWRAFIKKLTDFPNSLKAGGVYALVNLTGCGEKAREGALRDCQGLPANYAVDANYEPHRWTVFDNSPSEQPISEKQVVEVAGKQKQWIDLSREERREYEQGPKNK